MSFDIASIAWYAAICGALAALAPTLRTLVTRIVLGGAVGIAAASLLPAVRAMMGY
jgi:hypothetical protein